MKKSKKVRIFVASLLLAVTVCLAAVPLSGAYTQRDRIIDVALNEVGYTQQNGYNKYSEEFGNGYTAWCNYFVVWCAKQAGVSAEAVTGNGSYGGNCTLYMQGLKNKGRFFENDGSYTPQKGDLVFYNSTKSTSASTHIGFVISATDSTVTTVEGNVSVNGTRGVAKNVRSRYSYVGNMIIIGFGVPAYSGEEVPHVTQKPKNTVQNNVEKKTSASPKKELIDVKKFQTNASAEERIKLGEDIKSSAKEDTACIFGLTSLNKSKPSYECLGKFCICDKIYNKEK